MPNPTHFHTGLPQPESAEKKRSQSGFNLQIPHPVPSEQLTEPNPPYKPKKGFQFCGLCKQHFSHLWRHFETKHSDEPLVENLINQRIVSRKLFDVEWAKLKTSMKDNAGLINKSKVVCDCGKEIDNKYLAEHIRTKCAPNRNIENRKLKVRSLKSKKLKSTSLQPTKNMLKQHKESKHEGVRYPCDECEYSANRLANLKMHKQSKHDGVRYPCDQCEYSASYKSELNKHKRMKHTNTQECGFTARKTNLAGENIEPEPVHVKLEPEPVLVKYEPEFGIYDNTIKSEVLEEDPLAGL